MFSSLLYLGVMLVVICIWFILIKRPIYEAVFVSFLVLLTVTGTWGNFAVYFYEGISNSLLYSMVAFVALSIILTKTKIVDSCIAVILALIGRVTGGAGYASIIASAFMGALSGSGPGNAMATGAITAPAMKRSGFPPELTANIISNASYMGNMIPPSSNIVAAMGAFTALYPQANLTTGQFWIILWGISLWFLGQRMLMVWIFCKYYKVAPMSREEIPSLKQTLREGWRGLLLPVVILMPFVLDYFFKSTFFTARLGEQGAKYMSSSILLFAGGLAAIYTCCITEDKASVSFSRLAAMMEKSIKSIAPAIGVCVFGYMIGGLFNDLNVSEELGMLITSWKFNKIGTVIAICAITCVMGMVIPGSSIVVIFGPVFITSLASSGVDPMLAAAMLPCICGVMCGITPPLGLGMYAGMTLAGSDLDKTFKNNLWWVSTQFLMQVIVLMGWLPILGL